MTTQKGVENIAKALQVNQCVRERAIGADWLYPEKIAEIREQCNQEIYGKTTEVRPSQN